MRHGFFLGGDRHNAIIHAQNSAQLCTSLYFALLAVSFILYFVHALHEMKLPSFTALLLETFCCSNFCHQEHHRQVYFNS